MCRTSELHALSVSFDQKPEELISVQGPAQEVALPLVAAEIPDEAGMFLTDDTLTDDLNFKRIGNAHDGLDHLSVFR